LTWRSEYQAVTVSKKYYSFSDYLILNIIF